MRNKIFSITLCVILVLLAAYTYTLKNEIRFQKMKTEQYSRTIDSLRKIMESEKTQGLLMRETAERAITKSQKEADSLRRLNK